MTDPRRTPILSRKQPQQSRSTDLVAAVLDAAVQVLAREGAHRFTTARVAERAGVSIGSLYQYFPNKAAILFRLQSEEWERTTAMLRDILEDRGCPPPTRVRRVVHAFVTSECAEAAMRLALSDAAPLYRDAPEARSTRAGGTDIIRRFMDDALPGAGEDVTALAADLVGATLSQVAKHFSEQPRTSEAIAAYADAMADMICAYLDTLRAAGSR